MLYPSCFCCYLIPNTSDFNHGPSSNIWSGRKPNCNACPFLPFSSLYGVSIAMQQVGTANESSPWHTSIGSCSAQMEFQDILAVQTFLSLLRCVMQPYLSRQLQGYKKALASRQPAFYTNDKILHWQRTRTYPWKQWYNYCMKTKQYIYRIEKVESGNGLDWKGP